MAVLQYILIAFMIFAVVMFFIGIRYLFDCESGTFMVNSMLCVLLFVLSFNVYKGTEAQEKLKAVLEQQKAEAQLRCIGQMAHDFGFQKEEIENTDLVWLYDSYISCHKGCTRKDIVDFLILHGDSFALDDRDVHELLKAEPKGSLSQTCVPALVSFYYNDGDRFQKVTYDLEKGLCHVNGALSLVMSDEKIEKIRNMVDTCGIREWRDFRSAEAGEDASLTGWRLVIKTEGGCVAVYSSDSFDDFPAGFEEVFNLMEIEL